jgi:hypothetical protein
VKWLKNVVLYLINYTLQKIHLQDRKHTENEIQKVYDVARSWISDSKNPTECSSGELEPAEKEPTPRGPKQDPPVRMSRDFSKHKWEKIVTAGQGKKKYTARQCRVCTKTRNRVKQGTYVNGVLFHFTEVSALRGSTP